MLRTLNQLFAKTLLMAPLLVLLGNSAQAVEPTNIEEFFRCPPALSAQAELQFGPGTSLLTDCLHVQSGIKVVASWKTAALNKKFNASKEAISTRNIYRDYENNYGMQLGSDYKLVVIAYSAGGRWLLKDESYNRIYGATTGNPTRAIVEEMINKGIPVYMCQNVMRNNGIVTQDLLPGVRMVPAGITGVLDFQHRGYTYISP